MAIVLLLNSGWMSYAGQDSSGAYSITWIVYGTTFSIVTRDKPLTPRILREIESELLKLEHIFSIYRKESEVRKLALQEKHKKIKVSKDLFEVIKLSKKIYDASDGSFDPSIGQVLEKWGMYNTTKFHLKERKVSPPGVHFSSIHIDESTQSIWFEKEPLLLDFGGIAKGYAVDKIATHLRKNGYHEVFINLGGEIYALDERKNPEGWEVYLEDPDSPGRIIRGPFLLEKCALSTSANTYRHFSNDPSRGHLFHPLTGLPVRSRVLSVWVFAPKATLADGLATAFFVAGDEVSIWNKLLTVFRNVKIVVAKQENMRKTILTFGQKSLPGCG